MTIGPLTSAPPGAAAFVWIEDDGGPVTRSLCDFAACRAQMPWARSRTSPATTRSCTRAMVSTSSSTRSTMPARSLPASRAPARWVMDGLSKRGRSPRPGRWGPRQVLAQAEVVDQIEAGIGYARAGPSLSMNDEGDSAVTWYRDGGGKRPNRDRDAPDQLDRGPRPGADREKPRRSFKRGHRLRICRGRGCSGRRRRLCRSGGQFVRGACRGPKALIGIPAYADPPASPVGVASYESSLSLDGTAMRSSAGREVPALLRPNASEVQGKSPVRGSRFRRRRSSRASRTLRPPANRARRQRFRHRRVGPDRRFWNPVARPNDLYDQRSRARDVSHRIPGRRSPPISS